MNCKETSPMRITLESHGDIYKWEGAWDSSFDELLDIFVGLCSTATYGDKSELYKHIYDRLNEEYLAEDVIFNHCKKSQS